MSLTIYLFSGWGFPRASLDPIVRRLQFTVAERPEEAQMLIGWSLGGIRALLAPLPAPRVLIASTARFTADPPDWPGMPAHLLRVMQRLLAGNPALALREFHALCALEGTPENEVERRARDTANIDFAELLNGVVELKRLDARPRLSAIRSPVLLLHGLHDRVIPIEAARATAARLPNALLCEHACAAHDLPLTDPDWVAERINNFTNTSLL